MRRPAQGFGVGAIGAFTGLLASGAAGLVFGGAIEETGGINIALQAFGAFGLRVGAFGSAVHFGATFGDKEN